LSSLIVLDPAQKMNHFRRHWDAALQAAALVEVKKDCKFKLNLLVPPS